MEELEELEHYKERWSIGSVNGVNVEICVEYALTAKCAGIVESEESAESMNITITGGSVERTRTTRSAWTAGDQISTERCGAQTQRSGELKIAEARDCRGVKF